MKHIDKYARIESKEINDLIYEIEKLVKPLFESVDPIEASVLSRHIEGTISYQAAARCVREIMKDAENNEHI